MNLYEVSTKIRVGRVNSTHWDVTPTLHASARSVEVAARNAEAKALRWARKEYAWSIDNDPSGWPISVVVTAVKLIDPDWL